MGRTIPVALTNAVRATGDRSRQWPESQVPV